MQLFPSGYIRAPDFTSILCRERTTLRASVALVTGQGNTVIENLREVAKRLAPGRACISVVSDHGFLKTIAALNLFPRPSELL
jgi:hypothetical protein